MTAHRYSPVPWAYEYSPYTVRSTHDARGVGAEIPAFEVFDADGNKIFDTNENTPAELQEANAQLASAAPRLLASLVKCANLLADHDESDGPEGEAYWEAVAAIAEATGTPSCLPSGPACGSVAPNESASIKEAAVVAYKFSKEDHELYTYLENNCVLIEDWGFVSLSEDRDEIFICMVNIDGTPDREPPHYNWTLVTAPEPEFLDEVNMVFGTAFRYESFAGR